MTLTRHTAQKLALKREVERVQERMTLKHKNTSRWVKHALTQKNNKGLQQAVAEQLARGKQLRLTLTLTLTRTRTRTRTRTLTLTLILTLTLTLAPNQVRSCGASRTT